MLIYNEISEDALVASISCHDAQNHFFALSRGNVHANFYRNLVIYQGYVRSRANGALENW